MRRRLLRLAGAALLALTGLWAPGAAMAKCVPPVPGQAPWADADAVFVGTVTSVAKRDRWATVRVEEVWHGPDQPAEVVVRGGPEDAETSVDRTYTVGMRYVFGVLVQDGMLLDNSCSGTTEAASTDLDAMRPAEIRTPGEANPTTGETGPDLAGLAGPVGLVAVIGGLLLAIVLVARRREA